MRKSPIDDLCLGLQFIPQEFVNLQVTHDEFLCMKALILLNIGKEHLNILFCFSVLKKLPNLRKRLGPREEKQIEMEFFFCFQFQNIDFRLKS